MNDHKRVPKFIYRDGKYFDKINECYYYVKEDGQWICRNTKDPTYVDCVDRTIFKDFVPILEQFARKIKLKKLLGK